MSSLLLPRSSKGWWRIFSPFSKPTAHQHAACGALTSGYLLLSYKSRLSYLEHRDCWHDPSVKYASRDRISSYTFFIDMDMKARFQKAMLPIGKWIEDRNLFSYIGIHLRSAMSLYDASLYQPLPTRRWQLSTSKATHKEEDMFSTDWNALTLIHANQEKESQYKSLLPRGL